MKKISRLTAFVLALLMLLQTAAFAEGGVALDDFDYSNYEGMLMSALDERGPLVDEGGELTDAAKYIPEQKDLPIYKSTEKQPLNVLPVGNEETVQVSLPEKGMVQLSVAANGGQWQVQVLNTWVAISGETGATCDITYAKVKNLFDLNREARVRWLSADGQSVSQIASVALAVSDTPTIQAAPVRNAPVYADDTNGANDANDANDDTPRHTFNIVIKYVFENGTAAADPYTANLAKGSNFSTTVSFPTVMGYLPYVSDVQQDSYDLNYTNIQQNVTITVTYKPTLVDYTVIYHQQNIDNDEYTEVDRETLQGLTKSQVPEMPEITRKYEGFYSLVYERPEIAADGSTIIDVYYDRYYYLMNFDLDGGYGVDPIYARYGTPISVGTPTKPGYIFKGWDTTVPATMPVPESSYITIKAIWQAEASAKVTIVIWGENADDEKYSYYKNAEVMAKTGTTLKYTDLQGKLICGKEEHTHTTNACGLNCTHVHDQTCYGIAATAQPVTPSDEAVKYFAKLSGGVQDGYIYYFNDNGYNNKGDKYYLRLNGNYYEYSGKPNKNKGSQVGSKVECDEGLMHKTDNFYKYQLKVTCTHTHDDSCYTCGKAEHTHTSECYYNGSFMDDKLWKLVRSDEVEVAADGTTIMNVYYDRVEFTLHFRSAYSNSDDHGTIKDKWGAKIGTQWAQKCDTAGTSSWSEKKDAGSPWTSYLDIMPQKDMTFYAYKTEGTSKAEYYIENLDGSYKLYYTNVASGTGLIVTDEDRFAIEGFTVDTNRSAKNKADFNGAKFYYTRNSYNLDFYNYNAVVEGKSQSVKYEASLNGYYFTPEYPVDLEPNAYTFAGWYTTAGCYPGSEADLSTMTMPANDLILYAKWTPVIHKVEFHLTENHTDIYTPTGAAQAYFEVAHGGNIAKEYVNKHLTKEEMNKAKPNGDYNFVVWYYYENDDKTGDKKYFDPTMQIRQDMVLYGEWNSDTLKQYTVRYVLKDDPNTKVADDLTGSGLAGTTKTFDAKGGADLYPAYQEGYFPTVKSSSLILDIEANELILTFEYVKMPAVPYTVKYINTETGTSVFDDETIPDKEVSDNVKAVVTETFKVIPGYMPDAYQKRLVVTADGENILYFYYTKDSQHAYYKITHYTENLATDAQGSPTWTEYASSQAQGDIGTTYTAEPMTIPGFTYEPDAPTVASGVLTAEGLELKLYYTRNEYPYQVRYLEQGSGKELHEPKDASGKYGQVISEEAIDIQDYERVSTSPASLNIRIETETDDNGKLIAKLNVITFYYKEKEATINYIPVGPEGLNTDGTPKPTEAGSVTPEFETVKILSGTAGGSTAAASSTTYRFVGWYDNAACEGNPLSTDERYMPTRPDSTLGDDGITTGGKWPEAGVTYYAKFVHATGDLKITKQGCETIDENQSFVFKVTGDGIVGELEVVIHGNSFVIIKDLPAGSYTVTENTAWSWRYTPDGNGKTANVTGGATETVTFTNSRDKVKWLDGNTYCDNRWSTKTSIKPGN